MFHIWSIAISSFHKKQWGKTSEWIRFPRMESLGFQDVESDGSFENGMQLGANLAF